MSKQIDSTGQVTATEAIVPVADLNAEGNVSSKVTMLKLLRMPPLKRRRLLELEAKKRGLMLPSPTRWAGAEEGGT